MKLCKCPTKQLEHSTVLPLAEFAHNSWKHEKAKYLPHELITGIIPSAKLMPLDDSTPTTEARLRELSNARMDVQQMLQKRINNRKDPPKYDVNQKVWLDVRNLQMKVLSKKLALRHYGPFIITEKVSAVAYRLKLPNHMKIHDVFHVDLLTPYQQNQIYGEAFPQPPPDLIEGEEEYEVEEIVSDQRHGRSCSLQYLIKWKGYPQSENSWVNAKDVHAPQLVKEYHNSQLQSQIATSQTYKRTPELQEEHHQLSKADTCLPNSNNRSLPTLPVPTLPSLRSTLPYTLTDIPTFLTRKSYPLSTQLLPLLLA
jgi:Chromo (CHRromatin Organisation MOdifier) domain/Integrase p58, C-terminal domain